MAPGAPARRRFLALLLTAIVPGLPGPGAAQGRDVVVFAAASLKTALDEIKAGWSRDTGTGVTVSYGGSNALARQIEQGAPADLFLSADLDWMDWAQGKGLVRAGSRVALLGNRLVLVAPKGRAAALDLRPGLDLAAALEGGRLAIANPDAVPAGKYARAALKRLGAWEAVEDRTAPAENVRAALLLVARGEAPLGIVYKSDALAEPRVTVVGILPQDSHPPIVYPAALTAASTNPDADAFLRHLRSGAARAVFEKQGFTVLSQPASGS